MNTRSGPALAALFAAAFVMGSAELLVVGVIDLIAADLAVPVSTAGAAVTAYALGIAIGGPILTALTIRSGRRAVHRALRPARGRAPVRHRARLLRGRLHAPSPP